MATMALRRGKTKRMCKGTGENSQGVLPTALFGAAAALFTDARDCTPHAQQDKVHPYIIIDEGKAHVFDVLIETR
jgi:hypothetical protein